MGLFADVKPKQVGFDVKPQAWLDRLMRLNYASANLAKSIFTGEEEPLTAIKKGLTGEDKTLYGDVLKSLGWEAFSPEEKAMRGVIGFGLDVAADPLTYIPVGGLIAKGIQKAGKVPAIAKGAVALRAARPVQLAGKALIPGFRPTSVRPEAWNKLLSIRRMAQNIEKLGTDDALKFSTGVLDDIKKLRQTGQVTEGTVGNLLQSVERRSFASGLPSNVRPIWTKLTSFADDVAKRRKAIGKTLLSDEDYTHWLHHLSEAERKSLEKTGLDIGFREFTTKSASDIRRKWKRFTNPVTGESFIGKRAKKGFTQSDQASIQEINKALGREFFSTDIPFTAFVTGKRIARQEAGQAFFDLVEDLGSKSRMAPEWIKSTAPELKGLYFNPHIAKEIDTIRKTFVGEKTTAEFVKLFDKVQNYWKLQTLGLFPSYHVRNAVGNVWNNFLGGVVNPQVYQDSYKILNKIYRNVPLERSEQVLYNLARKHGIFGRGIMGAEIPRAVPQALTVSEQAVKSTRRPAEIGMRFGEKQIEDPARFAHFIDKIRKRWTGEEAALSVKKYLFDYTELTPFESNVLRRLMPFYTWSRKNIPLQVEAFLKQPAKPLGFEKLRQEMGKAAGVTAEERELLPEWVKRRMPFFIPAKGKEKRYFPIESWLPLGDIMKLGRPANIIGELLTPILKAPIELVQNKVYYFDRPIEQYKGQTREIFSRDVPVRMEYLLRQVRLINELDRLIGKKKRAPGQLPIPKPIERAIRATTGVKIYRYDVDKARRSRIWEIQKELKALKIGLRQAERYGRTREMERVANQIGIVEKELARLK